MNRLLRLCIVVAALFAPAIAAAAPLSSAELLNLETYVACKEACGYGRKANLPTCVAQCGTASPAWEKDLVAPVDRTDRDLAFLEVMDAGQLQLICYDGTSGAVVPKPKCGSDDCKKNHTDAQCADGDHDGLFAWQEALIGSSDAVAQVQCKRDADCGVNGKGGFTSKCTAKQAIGASICEDRGNGATAFHLETREINDKEVLVYVYFDYSPVPTSMLDLYVDYDANLELTDARPLATLTNAGKTLLVRQITGTQPMLRLIALDESASTPIPPDPPDGKHTQSPIIEILFRRLNTNNATIKFDQDPSHEMGALSSTAPNTSSDYRADLKSADLWGSAIAVPSGDANRLVFQYSFDDARRPLSYSAAAKGSDLCPKIGDCVSLDPNADATKVRYAKKIAELETLQKGVALLDGQVDGVSDKAALFDGNVDHLELPVWMSGPDASNNYKKEAQQLSFSTWLYAEPGAGTDPRQIVFSHNDMSLERTATGLYLAPSAAQDKLDLVWFEGDYTSSGARKVTVATGISTRTWIHVGMSADPATRAVAIYLNGETKSVLNANSPSTLFACPAVDGQTAARIALHTEGAITGGHQPEVLFYATTESGQYHIQQLDMRAFTPRSIVDLPNASAEAPSYSATVDKIVYSSNAGGSFEIWLASGDGTNARPITTHFGNTSKEIFARRPRWAPDASGIIFESNAYSLDQQDNLATRTYHLYYIPYNTAKNDVELTTGGATLNALDYPTLAQGGTALMNRFRLAGTIDHNEYNVLWLSGNDATAGTRGDILFTSADPLFKNQNVRRLTLPADLSNAVASAPVAITVPSQDGAEVAAVAAFHGETVDPVRGKVSVTKALLREEWVSYADTTSYAVRLEDTTTAEGAPGLAATVSFTGAGYAPTCWDTNADQTCNPQENKTGDVDAQGNPVCDVRDCYPSEISDLYVQFDFTALDPRAAESTAAPQLGPAPGGINKRIEIARTDASTASFVRVGMASPTNNTPLSVNMDIARIVFKKLKSAASPVTPRQRSIRTQLGILDLESASTQPRDFVIEQTDGAFSELLDAAFSPKGDRLVLSVIQQARPTLLMTKDLVSSAGASKLLAKAARVLGLSWSEVERYYACNWVGAYRDTQRGLYTAALHGAVDELKIYNYVRTADAFRSEWARGRESLVKAGRAGQLPSSEPTCSGDSLECPAYHVCEAGKCVVKACDPSKPTDCSTGQCTLAAITQTSGQPLDWVCSAECNVDNECFRQQCMNGPCRFCDTTRHACSECRSAVQDYGSFKVDTTEGCPDQNGYACVGGSCVSQCYGLVNGKSKYLCDPTTEYCKRGKCTLLDWDWKDFSPMTLSGLGEMVLLNQNPMPTIASQELWPVEIEAYGVDDNGIPPEVLVEALADGVNNGNWFELGRVLVYNATRKEAEQNHYLVQTPYRLSSLRLRLVTSPLANLNAASTGFKERGQGFCSAAQYASGECTFRASGSRPTIGYPVGISRRDLLVACAQRGGCTGQTFDPLRAPASGVPSGPPGFADLRRDPTLGDFLDDAIRGIKSDPAQKYLASGQPTVVVDGVTVSGNSIGFTQDRVCSYEGTLEPLDPPTGSANPRHKRIWFGDVAREISNQKTTFFSSATTSTLLTFPTSTTPYALLNCSMASPVEPGLVAGVQLDINPALRGVLFKPKPAPNMLETPNGCYVIDANGGRAQCYEMVGGDAVFDVMATEGDLYKTLDLDTYRSFGYPMESDNPTYDCKISTPDAGADANASAPTKK